MMCFLFFQWIFNDADASKCRGREVSVCSECSTLILSECFFVSYNSACLFAVTNQWLQAMCFLWPSWELYPLLIRLRSWWRMVCHFCNTFALTWWILIASDKIPYLMVPCQAECLAFWFCEAFESWRVAWEDWPCFLGNRRAVTAELIAALSLRIFFNLMIAFGVHLFLQLPPGMWSLSMICKRKVNATSCTLAFSFHSCQ